MVFQESVSIQTRGRGSLEITTEVNNIVTNSGILKGMCNVFIQHTSASLMLCENADPDVRTDMENFMRHLVPDGDPIFSHTTEGPDDMPAHVRSILTDSSINIPIESGKCSLGIWQGLYLWEHRHQGHRRNIMVTVYGD